MAGKHRTTPTEPRVQVRLRMAPALKAHLEDLALEHGTSFNEEVTRRLQDQRRKPRTTHQRLMELRPLAEDPFVPVEELLRRMEAINPYHGPLPDRVEPPDGITEIEWLHPGGRWS